MESKITRQHTYYTRDVLPSRVVRRIVKSDPSNVEKLLNEQLILVKQLEEDLVKIRKEIVGLLDKFLSSDNISDAAVLPDSFLEMVQNDIIKEEKDLRNDLIGHQECVEMCKSESADNGMTSCTYLEMARLKRDRLTSQLSVIVSQRETIFAALEVLQHSINLVIDEDSQLMKLQEEYSSLTLTIKAEHEKLEKLTNLQRKAKAS